MTEKRGMKALEAWCRKVTNGYRDVKINNMTTAWRDGLAFCAIIHHFQPDLIDFDSLSKDNIFQNNDLAFSMAERLGIPALLDAEDMVSYKVPDKLSILTYVSQLYQHFHALEPPSPAKRPLEVNHDATDVAESPEKRSAVEISSSSFPTASKSPSHPRTDVCQACKNRVYILERLIVDNKLYHRTCFKCLKCSTVLSPGSYVECDQSDQYECIQCPLPDEKSAKRRLSEAVLKRFSDTPNGKPAAPHSQSATPQKTGRQTLFDDSPKPSIIAAAAAKARSQFHDQNLNNVETENPVSLDTGQPIDEKPSCEPAIQFPQQQNGELNEASIDTVSSKTHDDTAARNSQSLETRQSSEHPSALPTEALLPVVTSVGDIRAEISSDVQNNNVKVPPSAKPPLPPVGQSDTNDSAAAKPALPQKPALLERPRFLPIHRPNHAKAVTEDREAEPVGGKAEVVCPSEPVPEITLSTAEDEAPKCDKELSATPDAVGAAVNTNPDDGAETSKFSSVGEANHNGERLDSEKVTVDTDSVSKKSDPCGLVGADRPVPVAAPRASRAKRQPVQVPQKQESRAAPVPPRRSTVQTLKDDSGEIPTPLKPPRHISAPEEGSRGVETPPPTRDADYPLELNPFGDDDEPVKPETGKKAEEGPKKKVSLNPFGDSDEGDEEEQVVPKAPEPVQRKLVPCYVNPFSSDSEEDSENSSRFSVSPVPAVHKPSSTHHSASPSLRASPAESASTLNLRKKRPAPKPPGLGSAGSSPGITPETTPRSSQRNPALPPKRIPPGGDVDDSFLTEKSLKELDNRNRTKAVQESAPPKTLSPDSLESQSERSESSAQHDVTRPANTFANWKKKKRRAPPLPTPRRRQVATISIKDIQAELLEIEEKHLELESRGVQIEKSIREKFNDEIDPSVEEEDLILQLFDLVNKKNELFRRQTELTYLKRQQRLEEEHADLEFQIRCLMEKSDDKKTAEDRSLEDQLIARLVEVVTQRSEIIESMEMDRMREAEEDQSLQQHQLGFQLCGSSNMGSMSSQGSLGGNTLSAVSPSAIATSSGKDKKKKKKKEKDKDKDKEKKKKSTKTKDEDKDTDETESRKKTPKDKKKKWF